MTMPKKKRDSLQVAAFHSFYKFHRLGGATKEMAFAGAVEKTSDDVFDAIVQNSEQAAALEIWMAHPPRRKPYRIQ